MNHSIWFHIIFLIISPIFWLGFYCAKEWLKKSNVVESEKIYLQCFIGFCLHALALNLT